MDHVSPFASGKGAIEEVKMYCRYKLEIVRRPKGTWLGLIIERHSEVVRILLAVLKRDVSRNSVRTVLRNSQRAMV